MQNNEFVESNSNITKLTEIKDNHEKNINETFKVYIRIKPYILKEINKLMNNTIITSKTNYTISIGKSLTKNNSNVIPQEKEKGHILKVEKNTFFLEDMKNHKNKIFLFDNIFNESSNNQNIFDEAIKPTINKILKGYNSTILAYGATGTGKTYTIFGDLTSNSYDEGIIFKACDYIFEKIEINRKDESKNNIETNYLIKISYLEIYNEIVKDLINENPSQILLVEDPLKGVFCQNSKELIIKDSIELKKIINEGNKRRTMASTIQNQFSSRSHAILQICLEKKITKLNSEKENNMEYYNSKFLVVDLAGSERGAEKGKRREEGVNINKSLFTLSNCLNILSDKKNTGKFIPYRDSKLTRLLKDSLCGNIITLMIACINSLSCSYSYDETLSTLNYANKAKKINKKVMKNIKEINFNNLHYKEMVDSLKNEIIQLKNIIKNQEIKLKNQVYPNKEIENDIKILDKKGLILEKENNLDNYMSDQNVMDISIENYNKIIEEISFGNFDINKLKSQIESIKRDKNHLEHCIMNDNDNNVNNKNISNKFNDIKIIYNKYIEIINEKLVENIEQNMIYNFNIKEITDLNQANNDKVSELEKKEKEEKVFEEINYTKKNIQDNNILKNEIIESIKKNNDQKKELQKLLLDLLNNKGDSMNNYIHILKEKDKLFKITKQYEKEIENYAKIQKQKDEDINKINRTIEVLKAKLKEKDKKINELQKKSLKKLEIKNSPKISYRNYLNNSKRNDSKKNKNKAGINGILSPMDKGDKSLRKTIIQKKYSFSNIMKEKNSFNNHCNSNHTSINKRHSTISIQKKDKTKNCNYKKNNNINNKNEINDENININNFNDIFEMQKYKDLTIPKTTITLTEIDHSGESNSKIYISKKEIGMKEIKSINKKFSKKNIVNNSEQIKKTKKYLTKSITVDLKRKNCSPEIKPNEILSTNKNDNNNKNYQSNQLIIKPFKPEQLSIDLNKIQNNQNIKIKNDLTEKINNIMLSKSNNNNNNKIQNSFITLRNSKMKNIKISKSNPKLIINNKSNKNVFKKLSLKEARFENKLKLEKISNEKNELNFAESFINEYNKMKYRKSVNNLYNLKTKNSITSSTLLIYNNKKNEENENKYCETDNNIPIIQIDQI